MHRLFASRFGGLGILYLVYLTISGLTRLILLVSSAAVADLGILQVAGVFLVGLVFDLVTAALLTIPVLLYLGLLPERLFHWTGHRILSLLVLAAGIYGVLFLAVAEWFFWDEFGTRFNFIAVDYLVYTNEVVGNINESYPVPAILAANALLTLLIMLAIGRTGALKSWFGSRSILLQRMRVAGIALAISVSAGMFLSNSSLALFQNRYNMELSRNGPFSFFASFRANELSYTDFYVTEDPAVAYARARDLVRTPGDSLLGPDQTSIRRQVHASGAARKFNVIQITVESLSASFLGAFGNPDGLTPNLDRLAKEGLLFTNFYATGTRTVRGMESLTLSVPPTPGRSIVKRPHNDHLFTLGSVMQDHGYRTQFIYGGFGYFDNMNTFFGGNGYQVIDRSSVEESEITFANIWGASDEDLYSWALDAADASHARGEPFFQFVMTTSNHRPYTYPEGRIDIPSHTGRAGAVKYTDYAIGQFIERARSKPWFANTVFVIVADHCASSAGKTTLPLENYRIPMIIYNPSLIPAGTVETLSSQIDYAPTILALLNWDYQSEFYGKNILAMQAQDERALVGTYQNLGYYHQGLLTVLQPRKQVAALDYSHPGNPVPAAPPGNEVADAIAFYQTAAEQFHRKMEL